MGIFAGSRDRSSAVYQQFLSLSTDFYFSPTIFSNERPFDPKMKHFIERLLAWPGFGTRCMQGEPLGQVSEPAAKFLNEQILIQRGIISRALYLLVFLQDDLQ